MSERLAKARLATCRKWPFASQAILSMVPVNKPGLNTLAVDKHWRIYFDEAFLEKIGTDMAAGLVLHEVDHLLKRHHRRGRLLVGEDDSLWDVWNQATDAAINGGLRRDGISLPDGVIFPEQLGQPEGLSAEEYFRALRPQQEPQDAPQAASGGQDDSQGQEGNQDAADGQHRGQGGQGSSNDSGAGESSDGDDQGETTGDGQGDEGQDRQAGGGTGTEGTADPGQPGPSAGTDQGAGAGSGADCESGADSAGQVVPQQPGASGSCSDGRQRPWELGPPTDENPGLDKADAEQVIHATARNVEKGVGSGSAGHKLWADEILNPPVDPAAKLLSLVRKYADLTAGIGERSYRRPSRRNGNPRMCLPGNVAPVPRITVIVDTSGSMGADDLGLALGMIRKVLNSFRIRDGIKVITGDEQGRTKEICLSDPRRINLAGGGGTDMANIITEAMDDKPKPQLLLVCTDGWTPWTPDPIGIPVVACLTNRLRDIPECYQPPSWIVPLELKGNRS
ncbi:MAG: hypothetical protein J5I93_25085 [Pirellulaceae bacterium]|nr:hypothetical protein [Pirellulaceae bacterium]